MRREWCDPPASLFHEMPRSFLLLLATILQITSLAFGMLWNVTTTITVNSDLCNYSSGWQFQTVSNPFGNRIAFAAQLGEQLRVTLPGEHELRSMVKHSLDNIPDQQKIRHR